MTLIDDYLELQTQYEALYGEKTVVWMEVGSFQEAYGVEPDGGRLRAVCDRLHLVLTRRNKQTGEPVSAKNPWMAGFPAVCWERYARMLVEDGYTVVQVEQRPVGKNEFERTVAQVLSPGTAAALLTAEDAAGRSATALEPHVHCLWIEKVTQRGGIDVPCVSLVALNVATGQTLWHEAFGTWRDPHRPRDDAQAFFRTFPCRELLVGGNETSEGVHENWLPFLGLAADVPVHVLPSGRAFATEEQRSTLWQRVYRGHNPDTFERTQGFASYSTAPMALAELLQFAWKHHESIVRRLPLPVAWASEDSDTGRLLKLEGNAASQLGLEEVWQMYAGPMSPLGRRALRDRLHAPSADVAQIAAWHDRVEAWTRCTDAVRLAARNVFQGIGDWERVHRRAVAGRVRPYDVRRLLDALDDVCALPFVGKMPPPSWNAYAAWWQERATVEGRAAVVSAATPLPWAWFPSARVPTELQEIARERDWLERWLEMLEQEVRQLPGADPSWFRVDALEGRRVLVVTSKRWSTLRGTEMGRLQGDVPLPEKTFEDPRLTELLDRWVGEEPVYRQTDARYWTASPAGANSVRLTCPLHAHVAHRHREVEEALAQGLEAAWRRLVAEWVEAWADTWGELHTWLAEEDVALRAADLALTYKYVRPSLLDDASEGAGIRAEGLRHPVLERRVTREAFVPNDVFLGSPETERTVLLYGVNAAGKSTLGRSLGLCTVMAQAGLFVPATRVELRPFRKVLCRILGNDDPSRGWSSFAVEMEELRAILLRADPDTLVLMDEPCRGTEVYSAQGLVAAAVHHLHVCLGARTWVATHLHGLEEMPEMRTPGIRRLHLAVRRDAQGRLVYERTLREGAGPGTYGIEVARAMGLPQNVLDMADEIRRREEGVTDDPRGRRSRYHALVWKQECGVCGRRAHHVHHIREQHTADVNGFIGCLHKDHPSNLVPLCEECHEQVHHGHLQIHGYRQTTDGVQLHWDDGNRKG